MINTQGRIINKIITNIETNKTITTAIKDINMKIKIFRLKTHTKSIMDMGGAKNGKITQIIIMIITDINKMISDRDMMANIMIDLIITKNTITIPIMREKITIVTITIKTITGIDKILTNLMIFRILIKEIIVKVIM